MALRKTKMTSFFCFVLFCFVFAIASLLASLFSLNGTRGSRGALAACHYITYEVRLSYSAKRLLLIIGDIGSKLDLHSKKLLNLTRIAR